MGIELARQGVPFRLIDKATHGAEYSQALVVQARTLEQFERYGLADLAVDRGRRISSAAIFSDKKQIVNFAFSRIQSRYPFVLMLPQSETEHLLQQHLESLGATVERGVELISVRQARDGLAVQLRRADGVVEALEVPWLAACDGAHSFVRHELNVAFPGERAAVSFFLGDLELEGSGLPADALQVHLHHGDVVFLAQLTGGLYRVIVALHAEQDKAPRQPTVVDFEDALRRCGVANVSIRSAAWMAPFRVHQRKVEHYRHGNVFFAGDAAHIHSPVAGQGMNTGIQDTANLSWKLAAVLRGADRSLLDAYDAERGEVGKALLRNTSLGLSAATAGNPIAEALRDFTVSIATSIPAVQSLLVGFVSETAINYRHSTAVVNAAHAGALRAGDRMPNPNVRHGRLLDPLRDGKPLVIAFNAEEAPHFERATSVAYPTGAVPELDHLLGAGQGFAVVRPDGYVGFLGSRHHETRLMEYARRSGLAG